MSSPKAGNREASKSPKYLWRRPFRRRHDIGASYSEAYYSLFTGV